MIGIILLIVTSLMYLYDYYSDSEFEEQTVIDEMWYAQRTLRSTGDVFVLKTKKYNIPIRRELSKVISIGEQIQIEKSNYFKIKKSVFYKGIKYEIPTIYCGKGILLYMFLISSIVALILFKTNSEWDYTALAYSVFFLLVLIFINILNGIDRIKIFPE